MKVSTTKSISEAGEKLKTEMDRMKTAFEAIECHFKSLGASVRASVFLKEENNVKWSLFWGKNSGNWGLYTERKAVDHTDITELRSSSREMRVLAADHISDLYEVLLVEMQKTVVQIEEAADQLDNFLSQFNEKVASIE